MNKKQADEVIGTYGGDAFGNGAMTMLRCRECTGLYLKAPELHKPVVMGMILIDDDGRAQRRRESNLAEIYAQNSKCRCPRTVDDGGNWPGMRSARSARPPMHESEWERTSGSPGRLFAWGASLEVPDEEEGNREDGSE